MLNVALLSKWHVHADDYASQAVKNKSVSVKLVWDEDSKRGNEWAEELGVPLEPDLEKVLRNPEIDAVIITSPTSLHKSIILAAADHKKHIFTEKVLAFTVKDCDEIYDAVNRNNIQLMVSLPKLTDNYFLFAQRVVEDGILGRLTSVRCRVAHNGGIPFEGNPYGWLPSHFFSLNETGGGALIDLGAHPIYLVNRLAGKAKAVTAVFQHVFGHEVEDSATVTVEYESGIIGSIETGFVTSFSPFQLELYGTDGALMIENEKIRYKNKRDNAQWQIPDQLPAPLPMPFTQWVNSIINNEPTSIKKEDVQNLTLINQAASLSNKQGRRVQVSEIEKKGGFF
ncbi:Gfo/Idh/MocA family protein [Pseudalkalibacillus caeni]|uniref:Gfo/Idh/MocA family oxidoreductase n=1 Tax=Exobacillus caeni TaxID=2574798 RepID=A0A5R9F7U4_9BACL|nr:Gfo/Idh/MocA family oxidoreductase [Pseudalkalibacillus caeni]TLS38396.1 Gfo/Idh/MocA family oxidoreductase [Pseudalkalibacillus caeni]